MLSKTTDPHPEYLELLKDSRRLLQPELDKPQKNCKGAVLRNQSNTFNWPVIELSFGPMHGPSAIANLERNYAHLHSRDFPPNQSRRVETETQESHMPETRRRKVMWVWTPTSFYRQVGTVCRWGYKENGDLTFS